MNLVRALLACVHLLQFCAYEKLAECCDSCVRCVSGLTTGLTQPVRNLFISVKALAVLYWKVAFTIFSVPWRVWDLLHTWCTASCYVLSRCSRLLRDIPYACLSLLCCICSQMQEAALHLLWLWTPSGIQAICTALAHSCRSTGTKGSHPAPPSRASVAYGSFVTSKIIRIAVSHSTALLLDGSYACLALLCHICSQLQKAALHLLWSWAPGWIQTTFTILTFLWHNTGKKGSAAAPPETASFGFGDYIVVIVRRVRTCPTEVPPPPSGTPGGATSDEDKSGMPDTQHAGGGGNQDATQVGFSLVILCWYWPAGVCLAALMLLSCLPACS